MKHGSTKMHWLSMPEQSLEINKHVVKDCLLSYAKETIGDGQYSSCTNVLYNKARCLCPFAKLSFSIT
ncbi:hypothetical protein RO3G_01087 [Rhizopus delemar RA 99-880]|uniref:Uncharacterized protein n=1 Tax=Rhizopus delemar (strain RA 99-880 / ATCC MYA-4621 / FGSC 9543 / NRRL 43880) TaxID=246409 RepID=I1BJK3_RHIO9|nr:hypothetical protein RO3G_01087 [Rhizopus delemar RA 99-880]|eukprot:EIE76383.1 hypothetical protein RO3G_01087 [Rhizopus delemar RA 99-880]